VVADVKQLGCLAENVPIRQQLRYTTLSEIVKHSLGTRQRAQSLTRRGVVPDL
jgi:hypothetical protein